MKNIETKARSDMIEKSKEFIAFIMKYQNGLNIDHFNPSSDLHLQQLLYAPYVIVPLPK